MFLRSVAWAAVACFVIAAFLLAWHLGHARSDGEEVSEATGKMLAAAGGDAEGEDAEVAKRANAVLEGQAGIDRHLAVGHALSLAMAFLAIVSGLLVHRAMSKAQAASSRDRRLLEGQIARRKTDADRANVLLSVSELTNVFGETRDVEAVLNEAARAIRRILAVENVVLEIYGSEESVFRRHIVEGEEEDIDLGDEIYEDVIGRGRTRLVNHLPSQEQFDSLVAKGFQSLLVTPLLHNRPGGIREPIGLIAVLCQTRRDFTTHEMSLLVIFAHQACLIIENAQLYQKTEHMAVRDGLTNLYNYRRFREVLDASLRESAETHRPLGLIMGDIDHFKQFNDTHGHLQGDMVLRTVGDILRTNVRGADTVARYGGEEFVVILPDTDLHGARLVGENLRARVERYHFPGEEEQPGGKLTITFGLAVYPADGQEAEPLIDAADRALYLGKRAGRNKLVAAAEYSDLEKTLGEGQAPGDEGKAPDAGA